MSVTFTDPVRTHLVPIDSVDTYPDKPRRGDLQALKESIAKNGFYSVLVAQESTYHVIVGNHRLIALREMGATVVPVMFVDATDADARRIVLADNRTSDLAYYDDPSLFRLLEALDGDLTGTGFDKASYELLLQGLEGSDILGNVAQGYVPADREAAYLDSDIRSIVLPYQGDEYDEVAGKLQELRKLTGLETNAEVVALLATYGSDNSTDLVLWSEA